MRSGERFCLMSIEIGKIKGLLVEDGEINKKDYPRESCYNWIKLISFLAQFSTGSVKSATNIKKRTNTMINSSFRICLYFLFTMRRIMPLIINAIKCQIGKFFILLSLLMLSSNIFRICRCQGK